MKLCNIIDEFSGVIDSSLYDLLKNGPQAVLETASPVILGILANYTHVLSSVSLNYYDDLARLILRNSYALTSREEQEVLDRRRILKKTVTLRYIGSNGENDDKSIDIGDCALFTWSNEQNSEKWPFAVARIISIRDAPLQELACVDGHEQCGDGSVENLVTFLGGCYPNFSISEESPLRAYTFEVERGFLDPDILFKLYSEHGYTT